MSLSLFGALILFAGMQILFALARYSHVRRKLRERQRAEYYAQKHREAGLPSLDRRGPNRSAPSG
jgi:hypothetical protein